MMHKQNGFHLVELIIVFFVVGLAVVIGMRVLEGGHNSPIPAVSAPTLKNKLLKGVSVSPKSYAAGDYADFYRQVASRGQIVTWAGSWTDIEHATAIVASAKQYKLTPIIILGVPSALDDITGQQLVATVRSFVAANQPAYIGLGNEVNRLHATTPVSYSAFVQWFAAAAKAVHDVSRSTKVFTVFQYEQLNGLRGGLFGGVNDPTKTDWALLADFKDADMIGFTTYPYLIYKHPADIPATYYQAIQDHTRLPFAFTEVAWPSGTEAAGYESSLVEQLAFVDRFATLTATAKPQFAVWPFLYDQHLNPPFSTISLSDVNGTKPAFDAWWR